MVESKRHSGSPEKKIAQVTGHPTLPPLQNPTGTAGSGVFEGIAKKFSTADIRTVYKFEKLLGGGHFGTVRLAHRISDPHVAKYAVKSILKENIKKDIKLLEEELAILTEVDHPNIIKFHETYIDYRYVHIVMELCEGGELFEKIVEMHRFSET